MDRAQLIRDLSDASARVRARAAWGLAGAHDPGALAALGAALKDEERAVRLAAAWSLGRIGSAPAAVVLSEARRDTDARLRSAARAALGEIVLHPPAVEALVRLGEPAVAPLLEALAAGHEATLQDSDRAAWGLRVCEAATAGLGKIGGPAAVPLCQAFNGEYAGARKHLSHALLTIGKPAVVAACAILEAGHDDVRAEAASLLGQLGDPCAVLPLCERLRDSQPIVRHAAARALGEIRDPGAVLPLMEQLRGGDPDMRNIAATALGKIGSCNAVPSLCRALEDGHWRVRLCAAEALAKLPDPRAIAPLCKAMARDYDPPEQTVQALIAIGEPAVPSLCEVLDADSTLAREAAAEALGKIGDSRALSSLHGALEDKDAAVRRKAAQALQRIVERPSVVEALAASGAPVVPPLCDVLKGGGAKARCHAAEALGRIAERDPLPALRVAVPLLRQLLAPWRVWESSEEEETYRIALERIETATASMKLPVPAAAPLPAPDDLPVPAAASSPSPDDLPLPASPPACDADQHGGTSLQTSR